jgi:hypothetical protein
MDPNAQVWQRASIHDGKVHGEKQHQGNANDLQAYGDKQETAANTRLPYASTLGQKKPAAAPVPKATATPAPKAAVKPAPKSLAQMTNAPTAYAKDDAGIPHIDAGGNYNPGASTMDPNGLVW